MVSSKWEDVRGWYHGWWEGVRREDLGWDGSIFDFPEKEDWSPQLDLRQAITIERPHQKGAYAECKSREPEADGIG